LYQEDGLSKGSMENGSGDDLDAIFGSAGCLIRGFAHESAMSPYREDPPRMFPGVLDDVPPDFDDCRAALSSYLWEEVTFCIWRRHSDTKWYHGRIEFPDLPDPDGSEFLLSAYDGRPETYCAWAEHYYQPHKFSLSALNWVFEHRPLTDEIVRELNPERSLTDLAGEILSSGYGSARAEPDATADRPRE
jgi:hypothetical protein